MISPLNNHCLIEVINEYDGIVGSDSQEVAKGVLRDFTPSPYHLTASAAIALDEGFLSQLKKFYKEKLNTVVYWEEYSDMGKKLEVGGKHYVMIPFYRLIGFEA